MEHLKHLQQAIRESVSQSVSRSNIRFFLSAYIFPVEGTFVQLLHRLDVLDTDGALGLLPCRGSTAARQSAGYFTADELLLSFILQIAGVFILSLRAKKE